MLLLTLLLLLLLSLLLSSLRLLLPAAVHGFHLGHADGGTCMHHAAADAAGRCHTQCALAGI
jgi:hypothetical protein